MIKGIEDSRALLSTEYEYTFEMKDCVINKTLNGEWSFTVDSFKEYEGDC